MRLPQPIVDIFSKILWNLNADLSLLSSCAILVIATAIIGMITIAYRSVIKTRVPETL